MARIYLDTSFFIGLIENQDNRQEEARRILHYEIGSDRFTSELTLNEFLVRVYDRHKHASDIDQRIKEIEVRIRSIARVVGFSDEINREAARLQSLFGEIHKHAVPPKEPRDRKFRWDAIHMATARAWKCERIYAWDGKWEKLPAEIKAGLGEIIAPARVPGLFALLEPLPAIEAPPESAPQTTADADAIPATGPSGPIAPEQPAAQSPAAAQETALPPEPFPPSNLPDDPGLPLPPEEGRRQAPPQGLARPRLSVQPPPDEPEN